MPRPDLPPPQKDTREERRKREHQRVDMFRQLGARQPRPERK